MAGALQRAWSRRGPLAWALRPASLLYGALAATDRSLHRRGLRRVDRLPVPVIVVGNVVAGGAGKTPVVIAIVEHLRRRGIEPGVVSRGYGRDTRGCLRVTANSSPAEAGDEPMLIARRTGAPVYVAARRADAARALLAAHPEVQAIVSDDGLQHHAMARDLEVCVFDERGAGNGWLLPAGPLREPWPRDVDLVLRPAGVPIDGFEVRRELADEAVRPDGTRRALAAFAPTPVTAVAGIARPEAFFAMLEGAGVRIARRIALPDHHAFDAPVPTGSEPLLCTEKDAVKLWRSQPAAWAVPLRIAIAPAFFAELDRRLDARLSSPDGPETP